MFQGQELGIPHPQNWEIEDYKDVERHKFYDVQVDQDRKKQANAGVLQQVQNSKTRKEKFPSREPDVSDIMDIIRLKDRDNARTPMPWDNVTRQMVASFPQKQSPGCE